MKPIRQLFRQPIKTVIGVILLTLASAALCICVGQSWTAVQTRVAIEQEYTTVALATNHYQYDEITGLLSSMEQPKEVTDYIAGLPQALPDVVQGIHYNRLASAYCPQMEPVHVEEMFRPIMYGAFPATTFPYEQCILEIELTTVGEPNQWKEDPLLYKMGGRSDDSLCTHLTGTVVQTVALNRCFDDPVGRMVHVPLQIDSPEAFQKLGLQVGKRYLVYGVNYSDTDWEMRTFGADWFDFKGKTVSPRDIDWERDLDWTRTIPEDSPGGGAVALLMTPDHDEGIGIYFPDYYAEQINTAFVYAYTNPLALVKHSASGAVLVTQGSDTVEISAEQWLERYAFPSIQEVTTTAEDILESDPLWKRAYEEMEINNHAFPVLGTDKVEGMLQFASEDAQVTEGRSFTQEEYQSGSPVCLISETVAQKNGLNIGDSLHLSLYEWDYAAPRQGFARDANPTPSWYSASSGFAQEGDFQIVGLYRQNNEWGNDLGTFTPQTILVPNASLHCKTFTTDLAVFSTIQLKNGTGDALLADAEAAGFPELFGILDQGYSEVAGALDGYAKAAGSVLWIGIGIFLAVVALYLILYPLAMGKQAKQMWTLGTPRKDIFQNLLLSGIFPAILGGFLAMPLSVVGNRWLQARLAESTESASITVSVTAFQLTLLCLLSAAAILLLTALCSWLMTRRSED